MSEADNRRLVEEAYDALNAHDLDRYGKLVDDSYVVDTVASPTPIRGGEAVKQLAATYFKAFPDFHQEIEQIIASGDWVVSRWLVTGTHKGEFNGIPPTSRRLPLTTNLQFCSSCESRRSNRLRATESNCNNWGGQQ